MRKIVSSMAVLICAVASAAEPPAQPAPPTPPAIMARVSQKPVALSDLPAPREFVTHHRTKIRGKALSYTATAGETYITNIAGEPIARFFSFSYMSDEPRDAGRPVMFVFNGGPGSASLWLHMGVLGPQRVALDQEVNPSNTPPFGVNDNAFSVLDVADLVFIDPVGTGFSRAAGNAVDTDFASVDADADSVARFIEAWLTKYGRWNSPKYLVGESYGTIRAAVLPRALMGGPMYNGVMRGITVDGVILVAPGFDVGVPPDPNAPDPATLALPSLAVTAWYHNKIDRKGLSAVQFYDEVKTFAATEYAVALGKQGSGALSDTEKQSLALKLHDYTGLPVDAWMRADLRIPKNEFRKQLLASQGLEVGAYDSRYTLPLAGSGGDPVADDPAMTRYVPGFVAAFNMMLRDHLKVTMPVAYSPITFSLAFTWDFSRVSGLPKGQSFAVDLATAMRRTPALRVMVTSGYYDMGATPAGSQSQVERGGLPLERVTFKNYESGHMLYLGGTAERFADDVRTFVLAGNSR
ncbi:S10 family peptidase [Steroidobacter flavus]|uniref:S10 family peptidase n=1 Tax=Steroidobacter flavus TaxID=1842136 RepID=A0ABV8SMY5_9GAMM